MTIQVIIQVPTDATTAVEIKRLKTADGSIDSTEYLTAGDRYDFYVYEGLNAVITEIETSAIPTARPAS